MRRIISLFLVIAMLVAYAPACMAADDPSEPIRVNCYTSYLGIPCYVYCRDIDGEAYILAEDASTITGYAYGDSDGYPEFHFLGKEHTPGKYYKDENGTFWVPIGETLTALEAEVAVAGGSLLVRSKIYTDDDLYALADEIIYEQEDEWDICELPGGVNVVALVSGTIYRVFTEWKFVDAFTGDYTRENYENALQLLMKADGTGDHVLIEFADFANDTLSEVGGLLKDREGAETIEDIMRVFSYGDYTDGEALLAMYDEITDPLGDISGYGGLDLGSQLNVFKHMLSITETSSLYVNMVKETFSSDVLHDLYGWGPTPMIDEVKHLVEFYQSDSYYDLLKEALREEVKTVASESISGAFGEYNKIGDTLELEKLLFDIAAKLFGSATITDLSASVETINCLHNIQQSAKRLYTVYSDSGHPVQAKYAAMLYLRCTMAWAQAYQVQQPNSNTFSRFRAANEMLEKLIAISDYDLVGVAENDPVKFDELEEVILPEEDTSFLGQTWVSEMVVNGYEIEERITFLDDGRISLTGGWPDSELFELYEGTCTLTETTADGTLYALSLVGGDVSYGYFPQDPYEVVIRVIPGANSKEIYVEYVSGDRLPYFVEDRLHFVYDEEWSI